jgi:hypothetical protein
MMRAHQPGSQPIDVPESIPNPAIPRTVPNPEPRPSEPVKVPVTQPHTFSELQASPGHRSSQRL